MRFNGGLWNVYLFHRIDSGDEDVNEVAGEGGRKMSKLIDADALKSAIERYLEKILSHKFLPIVKNAVREVGNDMIFAIDVQQTIDAVPVVHGHWITDEDGDSCCSVCGDQLSGELNPFKYCPFCGALMDEVTE